jgi:GNAT superfamily N-acetyltransferase
MIPAAERSPVILRQLTRDDYGFLLQTWSDSYVESAIFRDIFVRGSLNAKALYSAIFARAERLLRSGQTIIAAFDERPEYILGWIVYATSGGPVDYVYVRAGHRHLGIARMLLHAAGNLPDQPVRAKHWTVACEGKALLFVPTELRTGR